GRRAVRVDDRGAEVGSGDAVSQLLGRARPHDPLDELTERGVLALMAEGRSNQGIGRKLFLSPKTVETHVHRILTKLAIDDGGDDNRRVLAVLAYLGRS